MIATEALQKINLLGLDRIGLQNFLHTLGEKPFRANQLIQWIHQIQMHDFSEMSNLSRTLRQKLATHACIQLPEIMFEKIAHDGTHKWLLRLEDGNSIETVFIPEARRGTLCVSSQVGCALDCSFCSTGKQGFSRNLQMAEIIGQMQIALKQLGQGSKAIHPIITNVVFMGMGEPLLNFDPVVSAMQMLMDDNAYGLSKYRVTLSTSGVIPEMLRLKAESHAALAVSLHAPNDALRNTLVPLNKKYPLKALMTVCKEYFEAHPKRVVTFEYVMLKNVNDQPEHAKELIALLREVPCKLNLIPFNPFPNSPYACSPWEVILAFQQTLQQAGYHTTIRKTRGDDIDAACGQLVGKFKDKTTRHIRWLKKTTA